MTDDELRKKIKQLSPWYQNVKFNDKVNAISSHSKLSGEPIWPYIKQLLPEKLDGKRILDLGSNAGLFCIKLAQIGAEEVIGIESSSLHIKQSEFLKNYFGIKNIKFINDTIENMPNINLGKFDIILAISVLYWIGRSGANNSNHYDKKYRDIEFKYTKYISKLTDSIIIRMRNKEYNNKEYYTEVFKKLKFSPTNMVSEGESGRAVIIFERDKI